MDQPFLQPKLDKDAITYVLTETAEAEMRRSGGGTNMDRALLDYWIENYLRSAGPSTRAWMAQSEGNFPSALRSYAAALRGSREKSGIHAERGRIFFLTGQLDSAHSEMTRALEELRTEDKKKLVRFYESKALYEHSVGLILEQKGDRSGAREAYARALQEDLSYHPAHLRLADVALMMGDTVTARNELQLAVDIRGDDALVRFQYGQLLASLGEYEVARDQLLAATELEPHFAHPYALLGAVCEALGTPEQAFAAYQAFDERASKNNSRRPWVEGRLEALGSVLSSGGGL